MYECDYCDATFEAVSNLGGHIASAHRYGEVLEAGDQVPLFQTLTRLAEHLICLLNRSGRFLDVRGRARSP
ncbi:C2H2-type zinc finger protein [Halobellus litoreus]|uniref:C2H2-type zinc finger protein n=2 Tax=Halobellus litoreus TaxID=755310 RepID=A0ABD6DZS2_9EURY|nr:C2H2-type zinc finger protein [Halobellus litoreus]